MTVRQELPTALLADVAPLTPSLALHLAGPYMQDIPADLRPKGRPSREEGGATGRKQRLLYLALSGLRSRIAEEREQVYTLLNPVVEAGELTRKWLLHELEHYMPDEAIAYPDRLRDWHRANILLYDEHNQPEPQSTAALLLMRRLDRRKQRGWLPRRLPAPQSYVCWRQTEPDSEAELYALPLVPADQNTSALRPIPERKAAPYLLWTPWKGAAWNDSQAWLTTNQGVLRWVDEPTPEQLAHWLSPLQLAHLMDGNTGQDDLARRALPILATDRLSRHV